MKSCIVLVVVLSLAGPAACPAQSNGRIDFEGLVQTYFSWRAGEISGPGCGGDSACFDDGSYSSYELSAARLRVRARATERISGQFTIDASRSPVVLDAYIDIFLKTWASFRVGQFVLPYGFENYIERFDLMTGTRSLIAHHLWNNGVTSAYLRDIGLMVKGKYRFINYEVAQVNGAGFDYATDASDGTSGWGTDNNNCKDYVGRVYMAIPLFAGLGFSMYRGEWVDDRERNSWVLDLYLDTGKLIFQTEYERGHGLMLGGLWSDTDHCGYHWLIGYRFIPLLEGFYRYDKFDPTRGSVPDTMTDHYAGVNLNFMRRARLQICYVWRKEESVSLDNDRLQAFMSAKF